MKTYIQIYYALIQVADIGSKGTYLEWINLFEQTLATNEPALLFLDAKKHQLLIESECGRFIFTSARQKGGNENE